MANEESQPISNLNSGPMSMLSISNPKFFQRELPVKSIDDFKRLNEDRENEHHMKELDSSRRVIRQPSLI